MNQLEASKGTINVMSILSSVFEGIITGFFLMIDLFGIVMLVWMGASVSGTDETLDSIDPNGVSAGYEVIAAILGSGLGIIVMAVIVTLIVVATIGMIVFLILTIHGINVLAKANNRFYYDRVKYVKSIRRDSILKLIFNGLLFLLLLISCVQDGMGLGDVVFMLPAMAVCGFSIVNLCLISKKDTPVYPQNNWQM